jgi:hypothetical protein
MGLWKIAGIVGTCAGITIALAMVNIWLGILAMPILYGICESWLFD